jgi:hypothetical protein
LRLAIAGSLTPVGSPGRNAADGGVGGGSVAIGGENSREAARELRRRRIAAAEERMSNRTADTEES